VNGYFRFENSFTVGYDFKPILKIEDYAQGQGASGSAVALVKGLWRDKRKSAADMKVCEHFKKAFNASIGY
jgi:hypothetical protein